MQHAKLWDFFSIENIYLYAIMKKWKLMGENYRIYFHGEKFRWYSIEEMKCDKDIKLKNKETIEFIEKNF